MLKINAICLALMTYALAGSLDAQASARDSVVRELLLSEITALVAARSIELERRDSSDLRL